MLVMGLIFIAVPHWLIRLVTDQPELLKLSPPLLRLSGFVQVFFGTAIVLGQGMRGAGDTRATLVMTAASTYLVRLPLSYLLGIYMELGLWGIWLGLCVELFTRGMLFAARFVHGGWQKVKV